jgi:hypothetical protein
LIRQGRKKRIVSFRKRIFFAGFLLLFAFLTGCASIPGVGSSVLTGIAYTHIRVPLSEDLVNTPVVVVHTGGKIIQVKEPVSGYGFYAQWNSNAIGDIAQRYGLKEVYFADIEIFSILRIWTHNKVHVYGK